MTRSIKALCLFILLFIKSLSAQEDFQDTVRVGSLYYRQVGLPKLPLEIFCHIMDFARSRKFNADNRAFAEAIYKSGIIELIEAMHLSPHKYHFTVPINKVHALNPLQAGIAGAITFTQDPDLAKLPPEVAPLFNQIGRINLSQCSNISPKAVADLVSKCTNLKALDLEAYPHLTMTLIIALTLHENLESLCLRRAPYTLIDANDARITNLQHFLQFLQKPTKLRELDLGGWSRILEDNLFTTLQTCNPTLIINRASLYY